MMAFASCGSGSGSKDGDDEDGSSNEFFETPKDLTGTVWRGFWAGKDIFKGETDNDGVELNFLSNNDVIFSGFWYNDGEITPKRDETYIIKYSYSAPVGELEMEGFLVEKGDIRLTFGKFAIDGNKMISTGTKKNMILKRIK